MDTQNDSIIEEIMVLIDDNRLWASPIPYDYDVEDMQRNADRLLRINRERDLKGQL